MNQLSPVKIRQASIGPAVFWPNGPHEVFDTKGMVLYPNRYSSHAVGGPLESSISARATPEVLSRLATMLRCPLEIYDTRGYLVWWGYLFAVEIRIGMRQINISLGHTFNRVRVAYTLLEPGQVTSSQRMDTAWASHAQSMDRYGQKDYLRTLSATSTEFAEATRDLILSQQALPRKEVRSGESEGGSYSALLTGKGWFSTLDWILYEEDSGREGYTGTGGGVQAFGQNSSPSVIAQSFQIQSTKSWWLETASVKIQATGTPADNVVLDVMSDGGGVPGSVLSSGTIPNSAFSVAYQYLYADMSPRIQLSPGTTYWLRISRSGSLDADNYFKVDVDESLGYTSGVLRIFDGSWVARDPDADLLFTVNGTRETSKQMVDVINATGQFIRGMTIATQSGVYRNPFRNGETSGLYVLRDLLKAGTTNGKRYLAYVDRQRWLTVYEEPDPSNIAYQVDEFDRWWGKHNVLTPKSITPAGVWYTVKGLPATLNATDISDPGQYFIEKSTYVVNKDLLQVDPPDSVELTGISEII
jgi:hypothetical protein